MTGWWGSARLKNDLKRLDKHATTAGFNYDARLWLSTKTCLKTCYQYSNCILEVKMFGISCESFCCVLWTLPSISLVISVIFESLKMCYGLHCGTFRCWCLVVIASHRLLTLWSPLVQFISGERKSCFWHRRKNYFAASPQSWRALKMHVFKIRVRL